MTHKHTPWAVEELCAGNGNTYWQVLYEGKDVAHGTAKTVELVNAANALSGISTEAIEAGAVQGVIEAAKDAAIMLGRMIKPSDRRIEIYNNLRTALANMGVKP